MEFILQKFNSKRRKSRDKVISLVRMTAVVTALTLIPVPMEIAAIEEQKGTDRETESVLNTAQQESEAPKESEQETSMKEEPESASTDGSREESETPKETEQETSEKEETEPTSATTPTEPSRETEKETSGEAETEPTSATEPTKSEQLKETEQETSAKKETESAADVPQESESMKQTEAEADRREKEEKASNEKENDTVKSLKVKAPSAVEIKVPIYNYDVVNIVAPAKYAVALNPYELAVRTGEDEVSTEQVVSRNYGILNKSSTDKIVSVTFMVEDLNDGKLVFVDSAEEALEAEEDTYAVYLAAVPADDSGIWIDGEPVDCDTTAAELSDVEMQGAIDSAVPLGEGENTLSFKLSKAVYNFEDGRELILGEDDSEYEGSLKLLDLAPGEGGITAFTFIGAMNPKADWGKLLYGIKISAIYTYETATGKEEILEGTGAVVSTE